MGEQSVHLIRYIETHSVKDHVLLIMCNLWQEKASNNLYLLHHFKIYHHIWHHNLLYVILHYQGLDMLPFCPKELVALYCTQQRYKKEIWGSKYGAFPCRTAFI